MPVKFISKDGVKPTMAVSEANVPVVAIKPTGFKETGPGLVTHPIGTAKPSLNVPKERMGAARPWISKAGHAVAAANAHDPAGSTPSMRMQRKKAKGPGGMVSDGVPSGQQNSGGYELANAVGGYSAAEEA